MNESDSVQMAPDGTFSPMLISMAIPSVGCLGPCSAKLLANLLARLIAEQVHRVAGVVPQQVIGPAARLAERIDVRPAEEIGLHVHLQHLELAREDALVDPLMAGVEAARMARHRDDAGFLLHPHEPLGVRERVGHGNLDHDVLAGAHALLALRRMQLRRRGQNHRIEPRAAPGSPPGSPSSAVSSSCCATSRAASALEPASEITSTFGILRHCLEMLDAEGAVAGETNFHSALLFSRIMSPAAVLEAGTW